MDMSKAYWFYPVLINEVTELIEWSGEPLPTFQEAHDRSAEKIREHLISDQHKEHPIGGCPMRWSVMLEVSE